MDGTDRRLSEKSEQRFLNLYAHLLVYVNDRFDVIEEIETVADLEQHYTDELLPLRNTLYNESTTDLIEDFVEENPADLSEADLEQVAAWTDFVAGEFVVRYREDDEANQLREEIEELEQRIDDLHLLNLGLDSRRVNPVTVVTPLVQILTLWTAAAVL